MVSFFDYQVFFKAVFAYNNYNVLAESFLVCFVEFCFLTQTDLSKGYSPWMEAIFANIQTGLIFGIFFKAVFCITIGQDCQ